MRILYHHRTLGDGAEGIHVREMVKAFRELGHEVKVVGPAGEVLPERSRKSRALGAFKRSIPSAMFELCEMAYCCYSFWKTSREIQSFKPDFIYDRYITYNVGPVLAGMAWKVPVCLEVNAPLALERSSEQDERLVFSKIAFGVERWVCSNATRTVVVSTPLKDYLESVGVPGEKFIVMPNGVDPAKFSPHEKDLILRNELGIDNEDFVVGFTGVLRPWHGLDLLLSAVAGLVKQERRIFVLIVGDGPFRESLEMMVNDLLLEQRVCITGRVPHDKVPEYVALFDVAISPRATFYASPMKVIEYMALQKPVLVPRTPNFLDIIDESLNGIVFEEGNSSSIKDALASLCDSPEWCNELGRRAREKVESRLNWQWNAKEVCRYFSK